MINLRLKDSRGKESTTLTLVVIAFSGVMSRFIGGGLVEQWTVMTGTEFGVAMGAVGAIWMWREGQARAL